MGLIGGFCHLYIGQEAVAVGIQHALKPGDSVITGYRDHGHMLVCNMDPRRVMAELTGRSDRLLEGQGRLDAHVRPRAGLLRRPRHRRRPGPARHRPRLRPQVPGGWRRLRLPTWATARSTRARSTRASTWRRLWKLPILYVIENNRYAMGTAQVARRGRPAPVRPRHGLRHPRPPGRRHGRGRGARQGRGAGAPGPRRARGR